MRPIIVVVLAALAPTTAACVDVSVAAPTPVIDTVLLPAPGTTIFDIQRPDSLLAPGKHVVLGGDAIRVTATSAGSVWIQEAGSSGFCEHDGDLDLVAYRAIRVDVSAQLARGQHARVEGDIVEAGGRRWLANAAIKPGALDTPYLPYCDREGTALADPALEAVLVQTAGQPAGHVAPTGEWRLAPCFAPGSAITIAPLMSYSRPSEYQWVTGVVDHGPAGPAILPRDADDVFEVGDDACL